MGKIEIDHTGSGSGITLSSDGTDLLLDGTAVGGAALELYAENPSSPTAPSATGANAVAIGSGAKAASSHAIGLGPGSWARSDNTFAVFGDAQPSSVAAVAIGLGTVASGAAATALGRDSFSLGAGAVSLGKSRASGTDSFAAAIANNTSSYGATGANSVAIGYQAKATNTGSVALGTSTNASSSGSVALGSSANATGTASFAVGNSTSASGIYSVALGFQTTVSGSGSFAFGRTTHAYQANATASNSFAFGPASRAILSGKMVISGGDLIAVSTYQFGLQAGIQVLRNQTVDATPKVLVSDTGLSSPNTTNQVILPNNSAYAFHGTIVARQQASQGTASAAWKIEGLIRREGSAGTTVLVNSATTVLDNTPAWGMALSADTTNGGLKIEVTGAAATNIRFVATINTSEVTY